MLLVRLLGALFDLLVLPLRLLARVAASLTAPRGVWLTIKVDGPLADVVERPRLWRVRARAALSLHGLDELVAAMAEDRRVRGLLVTIESMSGGMASARSLRAALSRARACGKEVVVYLPAGGGSKEVYVASAASRVLLGPRAHLAPVGFRSASPYVKTALDRMGVAPEVFATGEFKAAGEPLVRDRMSAAQRAQVERIVGTYHDALLHAIAEGRGLDLERARAIIDEAPYFGPAAVEAGLSDDVAYEDEIPSKLHPDAPSAPARELRRRMVDAHAWLARKRRPLVRRVLPGPVIAVVPLHGPITHASGLLGALSTDERLVRMIRAVRRDRRVRGVIVHVDSPGGSALASDRIHREVEQLARDKPVVACMANVAASGGYYVAAPATRIVAQPTTVTGSIGVTSARLDPAGLLARLGINLEVVERGARAGLLSPVGPLDDGTREALERELEATYRGFIAVVASGRGMAEPEVERVAQGRVFTGADALEAKLVDVLGGFDTAVAEMKRLLDARERDRVKVALAKVPRAALRAEPPRAPAPALALAFPFLSERERLLVSLATSGERVVALGPITRT